MALERIVLNIIPTGEMPVFHCSQYENGRPVIIDLVSSDDDAFVVPEGATVELHCRKVDDNIVTLESDEVDNNTVTFVSTEQLTACSGDNLCEVVLYADTDPVQTIATLNFILHVEPDPLEGGLTSESQIHNLTEQIEEITQQVIGDDYYNKTEVDGLLAGKADQATTYTKSEVDTALNLKADKSTTYTKTQVDSALALKADKSDTYTKTQIDNALSAKANTADLATVATTGDYDDLINTPSIPAAQVQSDYAQADNTKVDYIKNKPDLSVFVTSDGLSEIIYDLLPTGTASGSIANFDTDLSLPLVECKSNIVASQASGTPTPSNPLPISGYTEANITRCGVNLFDVTWEIGHRWDGDGSYSSQADKNAGTPDKMPCKPNTTYAFIMNNIAQTTFMYLSEFDANKTHIQKGSSNTITTGTKYVTFTTGANTYYFAFSLYANTDLTSTEVSETGINYPATDTTYHAYNGQTYAVAFGQTVYGGVLDVTRGKLTVTHANIASYNGESINEPWLSSMDTYVPNTTPTTGAQVVYPLTTPFDIDLTPEVISAIVGTNNIYSDTNGDTTVQFKDSIQHYIDTRV